MKLESDTAAEGLTLEDLEIEPGEIETFIRDVIVHVGEPVILRHLTTGPVGTKD